MWLNKEIFLECLMVFVDYSLMVLRVDKLGKFYKVRLLYLILGEYFYIIYLYFKFIYVL